MIQPPVIENFSQRRKDSTDKKPPTRVGVVHAYVKNKDNQEDIQAFKLAEAQELARALHTTVVWAKGFSMRKAAAKTFLTPGVVAELIQAVEENAIELMVINGAIRASQQRSLEKALGCQVMDRTSLILAIFGSRAQTKEGVLQVELAALLYQKSRLMKSWTHLERQRGGLSFVGGPGETQLELDRRMLEARIKKIRKELEKVENTRSLQRKSRKKVPYPIVSVVGYTNAGKSTLFNRLTGARVLVQDQVFATLDPTMRLLALPSGKKIILSDTVGFISDIPTQLVAAFKSTLEEVLEADVLLHVIDGASGQACLQRQDVLQVLEEMGVSGTTPIIEVYNKNDIMSAAQKNSHSGDLALSARTGAGIQPLLEALDATLATQDVPFDLTLSLNEPEILAWLHRHAKVDAITFEEGIHVQGAFSVQNHGRFLRLYPGRLK